MQGNCDCLGVWNCRPAQSHGIHVTCEGAPLFLVVLCHKLQLVSVRYCVDPQRLTAVFDSRKQGQLLPLLAGVFDFLQGQWSRME